MITIALTKGRILKETLPLLAKAGIEPDEDISVSRKLMFATNRDDIRLNSINLMFQSVDKVNVLIVIFLYRFEIYGCI